MRLFTNPQMLVIFRLPPLTSFLPGSAVRGFGLNGEKVVRKLFYTASHTSLLPERNT